MLYAQLIMQQKDLGRHMHGGYHNKILGVAICSTDIATEDIWLPYAYRISQGNIAADRPTWLLFLLLTWHLTWNFFGC